MDFPAMGFAISGHMNTVHRPGLPPASPSPVGDNQRTGLNRPFSKPLQVVTLDSQGIPVNNGLTITFTAPAVGPSGKFATTGSNTASVVTNSDGIATAPAFTANNTWGTYTINASAAGIAGQASFTLTNYAFFVVPYLSYIPDCMTPQTACNTIGGAIDKASPGDTIFVASGMYTSPIINIFAGKNITLSGGWDTLFYVQNGFSYLDGNGSSRNLAVFSTGNKAERFVFQNGYGNSGGNIYISPDAGFILSNVAVRGGRADRGGGITINGGSLTLVNSTVTDNTAVASGGGIYIQAGSLTSEYSTIASNTAATSGGGLPAFRVEVSLSTAASWAPIKVL